MAADSGSVLLQAPETNHSPLRRRPERRGAATLAPNAAAFEEGFRFVKTYCNNTMYKLKWWGTFMRVRTLRQLDGTAEGQQGVLDRPAAACLLIRRADYARIEAERHRRVLRVVDGRAAVTHRDLEKTSAVT